MAARDIFAFGAIVYEMITGKKTFEGSSQASLIAAILDREPPAMSTMQPMTPRLLDRVVRKCLAKNPDHRWQAAGDLRDELTWIAEGRRIGAGIDRAVGAARPKRLVFDLGHHVHRLARRRSARDGIVSRPRSGRAGSDPIRRHDTEAAESPLRHDLAGRPVDCFRGDHVFRCDGALRSPRANRPMPEQLAGTEGAAAPFWSPDSRYIAFFAGGRIKKIRRLRVVPRRTSATRRTTGLEEPGTRRRPSSFRRRHSAARVSRRRRAGPISTRDESRQETSHHAPVLSARTVATTCTWRGHLSKRAVRSTSDTGLQGDRQALRRTIQSGLCRPGYLLFHREGTLFAQPFDANKIALTGDRRAHCR